jgi:hypothetical protein
MIVILACFVRLGQRMTIRAKSASTAAHFAAPSFETGVFSDDFAGSSAPTGGACSIRVFRTLPLDFLEGVANQEAKMSHRGWNDSVGLLDTGLWRLTADALLLRIRVAAEQRQKSMQNRQRVRRTSGDVEINGNDSIGAVVLLWMI